jgi:hypothetical protein
MPILIADIFFLFTTQYRGFFINLQYSYLNFTKYCIKLGNFV